MEGKIASMSIKEPFKATNTFVSIDEIEPIIRYAQTFADQDLSQAIDLDHLLMAVCTYETCLAHKLLRNGLKVNPSDVFAKLELERKTELDLIRNSTLDAIFVTALCVVNTVIWAILCHIASRQLIR